MPASLKLGGSPTFLLGVNYWSRGGGPRMWERFDAPRVRAELAQMRGVGLNVCRSFSFIPSFMPQPPKVDRQALGRLREFLDLCTETGMGTIASFLVGHMSGENYDFPGQAGRSPYTDPEVLGWQRELVRAVAGVCHDHPAVVGYLASNEMPLWGGRSDPDTIRTWAEALRRALREQDPARPFSLGDGVMNLKGGQNGFDPAALADLVDFVGPHTYYADPDPLRQALNAELCVRSLTHLGLPIIFEEFGCSSTQVSEANQALYYREVIHACLSAGACGALSWCFTDFGLDDEPPYRHHAFELGFGITRADGSEKPVCDELRRISELVRALDFPTLAPPRPRTAILVPAYFNTTYPFSWEDRSRMRRVLLQAYALCAAAGIEAELVPEDAELAPYELVLAPATQKLLSPTWHALLAHARRGKTVYWSYFHGDYTFHQGAWCAGFEELTACRHELRYGLCELPGDRLRLEGSGLAVTASTRCGEPFPRSYLPITPLSAEVLARDGQGRPALIRARHGEGQVVFLNHPLEYYLAEQHGTTAASRAHELYALLGRTAGVDPAVHASGAEVQARVVGSPAGPLLWLVNHGWQPTLTRVASPGGAAVHAAREDLRPGVSPVELAPKQVAIYRLQQG